MNKSHIRPWIASISILTVFAFTGCHPRNANPIIGSDGTGKITVPPLYDANSDGVYEVIRLGSVWSKGVNDTMDYDGIKKKISDKNYKEKDVIRSGNLQSAATIITIGNSECEYGETLLLHTSVTRKGANPPPSSNTCVPYDFREQQPEYSAHAGLLFLPRLNAALIATQASIYPGRMVAVDDPNHTSIAWLVDRFSIDVGIAGGTVLGDAPKELSGKAAFTAGIGLNLMGPIAIKGGILMYQDASRNNQLLATGYVGVTVDLFQAAGLGAK